MSVVTIQGETGTRKTAIAAALAARLGWRWCSFEDLFRACATVCHRSGDRGSVGDVRLEVDSATGGPQPMFRGRPIHSLHGPNAGDVGSFEDDPRVREMVAAEVRRFVGSHHSVVVGRNAVQAFPRAALHLHLRASPASHDQHRRTGRAYEGLTNEEASEDLDGGGREPTLRLGMVSWTSAFWSFDDTVSRLHERVNTALGRRRWSVSVVMPARCSRDNLGLVLPRLSAAATRCEADVQVVVVDDGSTDDTAAVATAGGAQVVSLDSSRGISGARNAGLQVATGDVVLFLDSDMLVEPDFLAEHLRLHAAANDAVVAGGRRHLPPGVTDTTDAEVLRPDSREALIDAYSYNMACLAHPWSIAYGCNLSIDRRFFERAVPDGFDESFVGWGLEDQELAFRLGRHGAQWAYSRAVSGAHIHHDRAMTQARFAGWKGNLRRFINKHKEASVLERLVPSMDPSSRVADYINYFREFDGGPTTVEVAELLVVRVPTADDPLAAVQEVVAAGGSTVALIDEGDRPELAVLTEAAAPGRGVRLYTGADWDRLSMPSEAAGVREGRGSTAGVRT